MPNYNFYDVFSWIDFERFSRDIIQEREGVAFELTKIGKDKGIDFKYKTDKVFIVGQAKKRKYYKDFIRGLKHEELKKVKRLKPDRYIITTTLSLSNSQVDEVFKIFDGYIISKQDILGKDELNELLEQKKYNEIERRYTKLWISSSNILQNILDETINRRQKNLVLQELDKIKSVSKFYVQNLSFDEALSVVNNENYVIISGTAGSGKTTLGRMLILFYMKKEYELVMVTDNISQAYEARYTDKKQVFFFDDFLGSFQFDDKMVGGRDLDSLNKFIDWVKKSKNKILILTTREYIFRRGQVKFKEQLNNEIFDLKKCIVDVSKYTRYEKAEILFNHLYYSEIDLEEITFFKDKKYYNTIILHSNYSPRLIEDATFKFELNDFTYRHQGSFYHWFKNYLDDPFSYWEKLFDKQSVASQLLLLNLFISCEPLEINLLKLSFDNVSKVYKKQFDNLKITPNTFKESLKELLDTFINIHEDDYNNTLVSFQNPSVNDFLLKYLRERQDVISFLIEGATFWNQLTFVFTTNFKYKPNNKYANRFGETIEEINDERYVGGEKILLEYNNAEILENKIIKDFDRLKFSNIKEKEFIGGFTFFSCLETIKISKLIDIAIFFDINKNLELKEFILNKAENIFNNFKEENKRKYVFMKNFPSLIRVIKSFISDPSPEEIVKMYRSTIFYSIDYYGLGILKEIYNEECKEYFEKEIKSIKTDIKKHIIDDLEWHDAEDGYESDRIQEIIEYSEDIFKKFGMRMTKKFKEKMELAAFEGFPRKHYSPWKWSVKKTSKEEKKQRKLKLKEREKEEKEIENLFNQVNEKKPIDALIDFEKRIKESKVDYFNRFLESIFGDNFTFNSIFIKLKSLAFKSLIDFKENFTINYLKENFFDNDKFESEEEVINVLNKINPILIEYNLRYRFGNNNLRDYLALLYINNDMNADVRKEFLTDEYKEIYLYNDHTDSGFWEMWLSINQDVFVNEFVRVEWNSFKEDLKFKNISNNLGLFLAITKYAEQTFNIGIDTKTNKMESLGISGGSGALSDIFRFYDKEDLFDLPELFFDSNSYDKEYKEPKFLKINKIMHNDISNYIKSNFGAYKHRFFHNDEYLNEHFQNILCYDIDLYKETYNESILLGLLEKAGLIESNYNLIKELNTFFEELI
ncbi:nSTAND3 domain-containing NTPase [Tenacibaculum amylolyticum]|uniref:nSTAND3 domain-containing NTPase n=1 Tax=Tenacibaculum amylolyticum TaxID=104269 RepID=UPI003892D15D